jgi:hypothetical protein
VSNATSVFESLILPARARDFATLRVRHCDRLVDLWGYFELLVIHSEDASCVYFAHSIFEYFQNGTTLLASPTFEQRSSSEVQA